MTRSILGRRGALANLSALSVQGDERVAAVSAPDAQVPHTQLGGLGHARAVATGADLLWRFKGSMKFPVVEAFDDGSWRSVIRGSGRDRRRSRGELPVRIVAYRIEGGGEATMLATTLLDHRAAPAAELAVLHHERWEIETDCDEVKTHILGPGAALRSKTPDLVFQEVDGLMLAHYAVRRLIHEAAEKSGEDPDRLSFVHSVRVMRRRIINPGAFPPGGPAGRRD
ncbi:MAG: hypothetical protein F4213_13810 [Boseongicola sp. SB0677_bin_26]|nr:hypothetical protein [Boseongicola sp. SB0665_bin_10]MYG27077.1 hypothetical protein [Boseongicola sp. SB0677_bin_26]